MPFASIFVSFFGSVSEHADLLVFEGPPMRFSYFSKLQTLKNRSKINQKTLSDLSYAFSLLFDRFGFDFDLQFGAVWPLRAFKICPKSDLETEPEDSGKTSFLRAHPGHPHTAYNIWIYQKDRPEGRFSACLITPKRSTRRSLFGTCSGKPAPKSDKGNLCADDELESKVGKHKNSAWDLLLVHGQCNEIHDFEQVATCKKIKEDIVQNMLGLLFEG